MTEPTRHSTTGRGAGDRSGAAAPRTAFDASPLDVLCGQGHLADIDRHFAALVAGLDGGGGSEVPLAAALASARARDGHACIALHEVAGAHWPEDGALRLPRLGVWIEALRASPVVARPGDEERCPLVLDDRSRLYLERLWTAERTVAAGLLRLAGDSEPAPDPHPDPGPGAGVTESPPVPGHGGDGMESPPVPEPGGDGTKNEPGTNPGAEFAPVADARAEIASDGGAGAGADADAERGGQLPGSDSVAASTGFPAGLPAGLEAALDRLFPGTAPDDRARVAARTAVGRRLCVVSGGPGTGKTTIAAAIVALFIELRLAAPGRIALVAPTGKAAARLQEAVRGRHRALTSQLPSLEGFEARATTVHRWLVSRARNRLPVDALVLDEGSMVDLTLMAKVLAALPDGARLVALGDASQLASVQPGAVFADVCRAGSGGGRSPLAPCVVELVRNWRFDEAGGIGRLAAAVVRGDAAAAVAALRDPRDDATELRPLADAGGFERLATTLAGERFAPALEAVRTLHEPGDGPGPLSSFRVLCAHRTGVFGAERFNHLVERRLRALALVPAHDVFYPGRPILVTRNDPRTGLSNGDTGVVLRDAGGRARVWFPELVDAEGRPQLVAPARLPPHESFFAVTVHRAQGSEYDEVTVVPGSGESRVATRELLYTAVTRARRRVVVYGTEESVRAAVERATDRSSGLHDALGGRAPRA